jgi:hypothetical protein
MNTTPKHRLRWYQYSLGSLFVLTVLVAIGGSWFAVKRQQVERQRAAVRWVEEMRGRTRYDWVKTRGNLNAQPPGPAWLRAWLGDDFFAHIVFVEVHGESVTDADLERLKGLRQLETLHLWKAQVTDAGLEHLKGLPRLKSLVLSWTKVTDAGLEDLRGLTQLEYVVLLGTKVTDAGLEHLRGLTQLQVLVLDYTQVTDAGLERLNGLSQLQTLWLKNTKVIHEGVKKLQEALPNCKIER